MADENTNTINDQTQIEHYNIIQVECRVDLTEDDLRVRADELITARNEEEVEIARHEQEKTAFKEAKERHGYALGLIQMEQRRLHNAIENRYEPRDVDCWERPRYSQGLMEIVRTDTGKVVKTRKLTEDELQDSLFAN